MTLILAYVFIIIAAFVLDFWKIKKERVAYQERMLALEEKNAKAEKQARRVQQAKQVKAKGSGEEPEPPCGPEEGWRGRWGCRCRRCRRVRRASGEAGPPRPVRQRLPVCRTVRRCKPRRRPPKRPKSSKTE